MELISLINAGIIAVSIQGSAMLWHKQGHRGICLYLLLIAMAAVFNIIESHFNSNIILISPVFQLLFGPALFLACGGLINEKFSNVDTWHFLPALITIFFINHVQLVIALGTISRIGYSVFTL